MSDTPKDGTDRPNVVVVGSINMDLIVRSARMPRPGETLSGHDFKTAPGGKGANQAVAAARLGVRCTMIGRVGDDLFGDQLRDGLAGHGVDIANVMTSPQTPSGVAVISVDDEGENAITIVAGANGMLCPDDVESLEGAIASADALLLQLEVPMPTVVLAAALAKRHGVLTVLDPAPAPSTALPDELFKVDILTPNQTEAQQITGEEASDAAEAKLVGAALIQRGAGHAVIKLGAKGALIVGRDGGVDHVPSFQVQVTDTTAAGDAFTAAMAVGLAEGLPLRQAVRMGCAAGALATRKLGAQAAMPDRSEVDQLLRARL